MTALKSGNWLNSKFYLLLFSHPFTTFFILFSLLPMECHWRQFISYLCFIYPYHPLRLSLHTFCWLSPLINNTSFSYLQNCTWSHNEDHKLSLICTLTKITLLTFMATSKYHSVKSKVLLLLRIYMNFCFKSLLSVYLHDFGMRNF